MDGVAAAVFAGDLRRGVVSNAAQHVDPLRGSSVWEIMLSIDLLEPKRARRLASFTRSEYFITPYPISFLFLFLFSLILSFFQDVGSVWRPTCGSNMRIRHVVSCVADVFYMTVVC